MIFTSIIWIIRNTMVVIDLNILNRITDLRTERNWTEYELAVRSTLPQSTISSWYRKNMLPSITSLEKICNAFDINLSQFFSENSEQVTLTVSQRELLDQWNRLEEIQKEKLLAFLKSL